MVAVHELADSTRTAVDAAAAVGCQLGQIVKSVVLAGGEAGRCSASAREIAESTWSGSART